MITYYSVPNCPVYISAIFIDGRDTGFYFSHKGAGEAKCYEAKPNGRELKLDKRTYHRYTFDNGTGELSQELMRKFKELDKWT